MFEQSKKSYWPNVLTGYVSAKREASSLAENEKLLEKERQLETLEHALEAEQSKLRALQDRFDLERREHRALLNWTKIVINQSGFSPISAEIETLAARLGGSDSRCVEELRQVTHKLEQKIDAEEDADRILEALLALGGRLFKYLGEYAPQKANVAKLLEELVDAINSTGHSNVSVDVPTVGSQANVTLMEVSGGGGVIKRVRNWGVRVNGHLKVRAQVDTS